jgi:hypothetical protein
VLADSIDGLRLRQQGTLFSFVLSFSRLREKLSRLDSQNTVLLKAKC